MYGSSVNMHSTSYWESDTYCHLTSTPLVTNDNFVNLYGYLWFCRTVCSKDSAVNTVS